MKSFPAERLQTALSFMQMGADLARVSLEDHPLCQLMMGLSKGPQPDADLFDGLKLDDCVVSLETFDLQAFLHPSPTWSFVQKFIDLFMIRMLLLVHRGIRDDPGRLKSHTYTLGPGSKPFAPI